MELEFVRVTAWHEEAQGGYAVSASKVEGKHMFCAHYGNQTLGCDPDAERCREMCRRHANPIPEVDFPTHCDMQSGGGK